MKKEVGAVGLLPDGRAVRVLKMDSQRMLELMERVGGALPVVAPGEKAIVDGKVQAKISKHTQMATIGMCVRQVTRGPVEFVTKKRAPTAEEVGQAKAAGQAAPKHVNDGIDFDATLRPLAENENDPRWISVGEQELENLDASNDKSMFSLFSDPACWKAVLARISEAGGGASSDPFAGKLLRSFSG